MLYTYNLFQHLYKTLPPLVLGEIREQMKEFLDLCQEKSDMNLEDLENKMVEFGYEVWPYNQAFNEFYDLNLEKHGEHFLLSFLSSDLQNRFLDFKIYGGSLRELISGNPAEFFSSEERAELCVALVEMEQKIREFAKQEVLTLKKKDYLKKVSQYKKTLKNLKKEIGDLFELAEKEEDHPSLARELKEKAKSLEYSLCFLGPDTDHANVCDIKDFYKERKIHLDNLRGIHLEAEVDFYSSV